MLILTLNVPILTAPFRRNNRAFELFFALDPAKFKLPGCGKDLHRRHHDIFMTLGAFDYPAAETELSVILQQCGFTVMDDASTNRPDVEITGEALSEYGMRKGNLISCRARIEIKARNMVSGAILDVDRQTSVAVDLAEHIAAKTALQNGMDDLAERVVPKLVSHP